ncbi:alpha/beta hydrolase [Streptacidiphilus sp. N1-10]|uniref:Alpha/beta hydrolase n=1 Tax=Streptacidiphilus jeojiensis TaxID=3229225 RepID=A0ABV6XUA1_9ACTN
MPQHLAEKPAALSTPLSPPPDARMVSAKNGRQLCVKEWGKKNGTAVFVLHGTPGSRIGVAPRDGVLYRQGIRLIAYDRPGYGWSDRHLGRRVVDAAEDVEAIANQLDVDRFAVVGRSGGGPHALACAAKLGDRVIGTAALVSLAPRIGDDGMRDSWFEGMGPGNREEYGRAMEGLEALTESLRKRARAIHKAPEELITQLLAEVRAADLQVIADAGIRRILKDSYREALRQDGDGWIDDALAFVDDWGFRLSEITSRVLLWHGTDDVFSPVSHSSWLHEHLPGSELGMEPGAAHFDAIARLPDVLSLLTKPGAPGCD